MQVLCGKCGRGVDVGDAATGEKVVCPHCRASLTVPRLDPGDTMAGADGEEMGFAELSRRELRGTVEIGCNQCRRVFVVSAEFAGQRAKCPACGHVVRVPVFDEATPGQPLMAEDDTSVFSEDMDFTGVGKAVSPPAAPAPPADGPPVLPAPPDEPLPPLGHEAPPPAADVLASVSAPQPVGGRRRQRTGGDRLMKYGAVAGMLLLGAVSAFLVHKIVDSLRPRPQREAYTGPAETAPTHPAAADQPQVQPADPLAPPTSAGEPVEVDVLDVTVDVFAGDGYMPAAVGKEYWKCLVAFQAGDSDIVLGRGDQQATLSAGDINGRLVAIRHDRSGMQATAAPVVIPAETRREVTFVFEMPAGSTASVSSARLKVADAGIHHLFVRKAAIPADYAVFGTFEEIPPRNLRPLLRDPIMAAIQAAPGQRIVITADGDGGLDVALPVASLSGTGQPDSPGAYRLTLTDGRDTLHCRLRVLADERLLLYLADEPFHQMTFGDVEGTTAAVVAPPRGLAQIVDTPGFELPSGLDLQPRVTPAPVIDIPPRENGGSSIFDDP